ncbi:MAG: UvrB/UvrC motif-containing protein [Spirochaetaceae bacterium]
MNYDLSSMFKDWPYDPDNTTRVVATDDGRDVLQVRLPLGIEQYELVGRPDGARPFGCGSILEHLESQLAEYRMLHGTETGYELSRSECEMLQDEAILFYYRYLLLFQRNDFERVAADTEHNLRICTVLEQFCTIVELREPVVQYKPYIVRLHAMARAMIAMRQHRVEEAVMLIRNAIDLIEAMEDLDSPAFQFERIRSVTYLKTAIGQLVDHEAETENGVLETELEQAVVQENYERAAELRDRIRDLRAR